MSEVKVRPLVFDKYTVYKYLIDTYENINIKEVTVNGVNITEIEEYNIFEFVGKPEEEELEIMFFPFNNEFLNMVLKMHKEVGEFIEIKYHLAYRMGENYVTHVQRYGDKIVVLYSNQDELNNMFHALVTNLNKGDLRTRGNDIVKIKIKYKNWKLLYNDNKVVFSHLEEHNSNLRM